MPVIQSIDSALERTVGKHGVSDKALDDALGRADGALEILRARHADGSLPLLRLPETHDDLPAIRDTGRRLAEDATDIVILGTGGSWLGGQTLAQLAALPRARRRRLARAAAPAFHRQSRCRHFRHCCSQRLPHADHALRRHLEIRRHRRNLDADHRRAVGGEGRRPGDAHPRYFPRAHRAGQGRQAQRPARSARPLSRADARSRHRRRRPLFGAHQCRACCRPPCLASTSQRCAKARGLRWRRCWPRRKPPRCRPRSAQRLPSRWPRARASRSAC